MLLECKTPEATLLYLKKEHILRYQDLKQWENNIQQQKTAFAKSWSNYLRYKTSQITYLAYQHTWISLSDSFFSELGDFVNLMIERHPLITSCKRTMDETIYRAVQMTLWFFPKIAKATAFCSPLTQSFYSHALFKIMGMLIGVILTYMMFSNYQLVKMLSIGCLAEVLGKILNVEKFNDELASINQVDYMLSFNIKVYCCFLNLLFALVESVLNKDFYFFISALGGIAGSVIATYFVQKCCNNLTNHFDQVSPRQQ